MTRIKKALFITLLILLAFACHKDANPDPFDSLDILEKIQTLDGVSVTEITPTNGYSRLFQLDITQPVDHNNPTGPTFTQRAYLTHVDEKKTMVFAPNGYRSGPASSQEIATLLETNCLHVTHRYFYDARPDPLDWQYLTIWQSASDHHAIVALFKKIYKGKWVSSGGSKSGLTALFHRRYYPDDVDATIAYVAPFTFGPKDQRFPEYLRSIGGGDCFEKLKQVQQYVLRHRTDFLPLIDQYITASSAAYSMDHELLLELDIMDYPFTFWQYFNYSCASIPDTSTSTVAEIFAHYTGIVPISNFSDANIAFYEPYAYQALTELGAPAYETGYLEGLLKKIDPNDEGNPNYELVAPQGIDYTFNYSTIPEIYEWLQNQGDKIIYIYGQNDPWSAGAIQLTGAADAVFVMQEGANHLVKIRNLTNPEPVLDALNRWLGIEIELSAGKAFQIPEEGKSFRLGNE
jgi:hypothetical protein